MRRTIVLPEGLLVRPADAVALCAAEMNFADRECLAVPIDGYADALNSWSQDRPGSQVVLFWPPDEPSPGNLPWKAVTESRLALTIVHIEPTDTDPRPLNVPAEVVSIRLLFDPGRADTELSHAVSVLSLAFLLVDDDTWTGLRSRLSGGVDHTWSYVEWLSRGHEIAYEVARQTLEEFIAFNRRDLQAGLPPLTFEAGLTARVGTPERPDTSAFRPPSVATPPQGSEKEGRDWPAQEAARMGSSLAGALRTLAGHATRQLLSGFADDSRQTVVSQLSAWSEKVQNAIQGGNTSLLGIVTGLREATRKTARSAKGRATRPPGVIAAGERLASALRPLLQRLQALHQGRHVWRRRKYFRILAWVVSATVLAIAFSAAFLDLQSRADLLVYLAAASAGLLCWWLAERWSQRRRWDRPIESTRRSIATQWRATLDSESERITGDLITMADHRLAEQSSSSLSVRALSTADAAAAAMDALAGITSYLPALRLSDPVRQHVETGSGTTDAGLVRECHRRVSDAATRAWRRTVAEGLGEVGDYPEKLHDHLADSFRRVVSETRRESGVPLEGTSPDIWSTLDPGRLVRSSLATLVDPDAVLEGPSILITPSDLEGSIGAGLKTRVRSPWADTMVGVLFLSYHGEGG